jgi:hypothetical protein
LRDDPIDNMASNPQTAQRPSLVALVRGIIEDAKQLAIHQFELRKYQGLKQVAKTKSMAIWIGAGLGLSAIGFLLVTLMAVYLLQAFSDLPLWGCYGIVGAVLLVLGVGCLYGAKGRD